MSTALRAEFFYDDESRNWHYRVPALHINGGGVESRERAGEEMQRVQPSSSLGSPLPLPASTPRLAGEGDRSGRRNWQYDTTRKFRPRS